METRSFKIVLPVLLIGFGGGFYAAKRLISAPVAGASVASEVKKDITRTTITRTRTKEGTVVTEIQKTQEIDTTKQKSVYKRPDWTLGVSRSVLNAGGEREPRYTLEAARRIVGPVFGTASVSTDSSAAVGIRVEF